MKKFLFFILVIALVVCSAIIGFMFGSKDSKNNTNNSGNLNTNVEEKEKKYYLLKYGDYENAIMGIDKEGNTTKITKGSSSFYLDKDFLYWIDNTGDAFCGGEHNLYRVDINNPDNIENMGIKLNMCDTGFSVIDDNVYYFSKENEKFVAVTLSLKTKEKSIKELNLKYLFTVDFSDGTIAYINDHGMADYDSHYYSYNFKTNKLTALKYSRSYFEEEDYNFQENKGNRILFLNKNNYCLYDSTNNTEMFCVDMSKYDSELINHSYALGYV